MGLLEDFDQMTEDLGSGGREFEFLARSKALDLAADILAEVDLGPNLDGLDRLGVLLGGGIADTDVLRIHRSVFWCDHFLVERAGDLARLLE